MMYVYVNATPEIPKDKNEGLAADLGIFGLWILGSALLIVLILAAFVSSHVIYMRYFKKPYIEKKSQSVWFIEVEKVEEKTRPNYIVSEESDEDNSSVSSRSTEASEDLDRNEATHVGNKIKQDVGINQRPDSRSNASSNKDKNSVYTNPSYRDAVRHGVEF